MTLDEINALEQIKQLKARYYRLMDTKQWDAWGQVFTADCVFSVDQEVRQETPPEPTAVGRQAIVDFVKGRVDTATTVHHGHMPEIELLSPTTARGIWSFEDIVETPTRALHGHGHYTETYRVEDGAWRIASTRISRLRVMEPSTIDPRRQ